MKSSRLRSIGESIYDDINKNEYLLELYNELLRKYTRKLFNRINEDFNEKSLSDLLRFADILSKSSGNKNSGLHKIWSQQIVALLSKLYPQNYEVTFYKLSVLTACCNYQGMETEKQKLGQLSLFDELIDLSDKEYFKVPNSNDYFFEEQKSIFEGFKHQYFSYSAPTSMGKSYVMRAFIKQQISLNTNEEFAILVPTKALINEVKSKILSTLSENNLMQEKNYRVITSASDKLLEQKHYFIYVMTPERFLYLTNTTDKKVKYLFIDEAHKISTKDTRSAFYYELIDKLANMAEKPHIIFSSPNIPNPETYLKIIPNIGEKDKIQATYAPVCQMKYIINLSNGSVKAYNDYSKEFIPMGNANSSLNLTSVINHVSRSNDQNIIYCHSLRETMNQAVIFANALPDLNNDELNKLSDEIKKEISSDYYLVSLIKKGVAFHVGYLPASIRLRIENGFKDHIIKTLFCTSTLIEGVNLPADNLFITTFKNGQSSLDAVSFRNLVGRVGRIDHALFGNVFMINLNKEDDVIKKFEDLLQKDIPNQKLSIESSLTSTQKKSIISSLKTGDFEMQNKPNGTTEDEFDLMRKSALILMNNVNDGKESFVYTTLMKYGNQNDIDTIKSATSNLPKIIGLDVTPDQHISLSKLIRQGYSYPQMTIAGSIDFDSILTFLQTLSDVFKWNVYERKSLGNYNRLSLYANLLCKWMSGYGLNLIIRTSLEYHENNPDKGIYSNNWKIVDWYEYNNPEHINLAIADTLNTIENVILFSIANYFREFSTEYKKQHNLKYIPNDWYEFVEYGTTNELTITLQRYGYSREAANYIYKHFNEFIDYQHPTEYAQFSLKKDSLLSSKSDSVKSETTEIFENVPELFL